MEATIYEDCHNLIELFVSAGEVSFESFSVQWKQMMFKHMYSCQTSIIEVLLTTSAIFHMAKRTICAKDEFGKYLSTAEGNEQRNLLRRIGGLYLMYGIYFKQPTRRYVKVQVSIDTWREMISFIESLQLDPQMDCVRYTFWRLYQADAFRFTALDYMVGLEGLVDYDKIGYDNMEAEQSDLVKLKLKHKLSAVSELDASLDGVTKLEHTYNSIKKAINESCKTGRTSQALPPTSIFHNIQAAISNIKNIMHNVPVEIANDVKENDQTPNTRRDIKRKAAGITDNCEGEQSADDSDESEPICDTRRHRNNKREYNKKSQLSRFSKPLEVFNEHLPDHILQDLINPSTSGEDEGEENDQEIDAMNTTKNGDESETNA